MTLPLNSWLTSGGEWGLKPAILTPFPELSEESDREEGGESADVSLYPHSYRCGLPAPGLPDVPEQHQM